MSTFIYTNKLNQYHDFLVGAHVLGFQGCGHTNKLHAGYFITPNSFQLKCLQKCTSIEYAYVYQIGHTLLVEAFLFLSCLHNHHLLL